MESMKIQKNNTKKKGLLENFIIYLQINLRK